MTRLTLRQLRIVLAIADHRSLVAAAKHLKMTQPAISKALQETEALLGVEMFSRTNRGVLPTLFGEALAIHGRKIIAQLSHATGEIKDLREGVGGRIVVGTLLAASADLLPRAVAKLHEERPNVAISIVDGANDRLLPDLHIGRLDLVVGRLPDAHQREGLELETLINDVSCVVVRTSDPLAEQASVSPEEMSQRSWVLPRPETTLRHQIEVAFRENGMEPPYAIDSVSQLTNRRLVLDHGYLSVWPWLLAHRDVVGGRVVILPFKLDATEGPVGITTRADMAPSPAAQAFIRILREIAATIDTYPDGVRGGSGAGSFGAARAQGGARR